MAIERKGGAVIFNRGEARALAYLAGHYGDEATAIRFAVLHEAARLRERRAAAQRQAAAQVEAEEVHHDDTSAK